MPEAIAGLQRRDDRGADARSLEAMGRIDPQPIPAPPPGGPPVGEPPPPPPSPVDEREAAALAAALAEAGIEASPGDEAAVRALAALDSATVAAVERWLKAKKPKAETK